MHPNYYYSFPRILSGQLSFAHKTGRGTFENHNSRLNVKERLSDRKLL